MPGCVAVQIFGITVDIFMSSDVCVKTEKESWSETFEGQDSDSGSSDWSLLF